MLGHDSNSSARPRRTLSGRMTGRARGVQILLAAALVHGGCGVSVDQGQMDRSFLTGTPCAPPCWHSLEPGRSSYADVIQTIETLPFVDRTTIRERPTVGWGGEEEIVVTFGGPRRGSQFGGTAVLSEGLLTMVVIRVGYPLTLAEAVERLGQPELFAFVPTPGAECDIVLIWPELRMAVSRMSPTPCPTRSEILGGVRPSATIQVSHITYGIGQGLLDGLREGVPYMEWSGFPDD